MINIKYMTVSIKLIPKNAKKRAKKIARVINQKAKEINFWNGSFFSFLIKASEIHKKIIINKSVFKLKKRVTNLGKIDSSEKSKV